VTGAALPTIVKVTETTLSPWVTVIGRSVQFPGQPRPEDYHSLRQADYVTVFAVTPDGRIPLVEQFRPALERKTLELPGGLLDKDEAPLLSATRELLEETGRATRGDVTLLGRLAPDSGRLENSLWGYFATVDEPDPNWKPEAGVSSVTVSKAEFRDLILSGEFDHALHIALVGMSLTRNLFSWDR